MAERSDIYILIALLSSPTLYLAANRLLALNLSPYQNRMYIPAIQITVNPASSPTPPSTPSFKNMGLENKMAAAARVLRAKSLAAKRDAEYCGYVNGRYKNMLWKTTYVPPTLRPAPMVGTIQWIDSRDVNAKMKRPAGMRYVP